MSSAPARAPANLNLRRHPVPGLLALVLLSPLRPFLGMLRRPAPDAPAAVFASYMVGDLYMALPALKRLAAARPVRVFCRPDCAEILAREGLDAIPFDNTFFTRRTPAAFLRTARAAWALRRARGNALEALAEAPVEAPVGAPASARAALAPAVYDLDASPLTALWMRLAGIPRIVSYRRDFGVLFDETFTLPPPAVHQADRDMAVAEHVLSDSSGGGPGPRAPAAPLPEAAAPGPEPVSPVPSSPSSPWLLSVWTRKPVKNWPLERWDRFLEGLLDQGVACAVLLAPDGDDDYARFRARWEGRVGFVAGSLDEIADAVQRSAGVIATDNFLGHMAGYYGKPVVWINMVSPAAQVMPRGPRTIAVAPEPAPGSAPESLRTARAGVTVEAVRRAFEAARAPRAL